MASMDKLKQTIVIALVAVVVVAAGGWHFLVSPQRSSVASLNAEAATVDASNGSLKGQIAQLKAQAADLPGEQAALAAVAKRLPPDLQEANLLDDLSHAADAANVDLQAITPSAPLLATAAAVVAPAPAPVTSAAGNSAAPKASRVSAASADQLYQIPVTLTVTGNYFDIEMYIHSLERMQRAMLINQISFAKSTVAVGTGTSAPAAGGTAGAAPTAGGGAAKPGSVTGKTTGGGAATGTKSTSKPIPGSAAAAQAELNRLVQVLPDSNTLSVTISGEVFSMYSPAAAAAAATATPAPTK
jgi:Tfp pilus assembly protein PilO